MQGCVVRQRNFKQQQDKEWDSGRRGRVTEEMRSGINETGVVKQQGMRGCGFVPAKTKRRSFFEGKMRVCLAGLGSAFYPLHHLERFTWRLVTQPPLKHRPIFTIPHEIKKNITMIRGKCHTRRNDRGEIKARPYFTSDPRRLTSDTSRSMALLGMPDLHTIGPNRSGCLCRKTITEM